MFQSVLINTYARRVKTQKYPRFFMRTTRSWGSIISSIKPHRPNNPDAMMYANMILMLMK